MSKQAELTQELYLYACGQRTARQVQAAFRAAGWQIDLREWVGNHLEAVTPEGQYVWLEV
jgi:hypothetical protein